MKEEFDFDDIRPYRDCEIDQAIEKLINEQDFLDILAFLYSAENVNGVVQKLKQTHTVLAFQLNFIVPLILQMVKNTNSEYEMNGTEKLDKDKKRLFISNHRDIIMDAGLLNTLLAVKKFETTEIAIGDNLCAKPWITDSLKINKCFLVRRSGSKRELFESFKKLSAYIRRNITENLSSVWIAQREGRTKDSNDRTQESLLKMFSMSGNSNMLQSFLDLNITPISISYEYDSCDYLKAKEFQQKRDDPDYKKTKDDDILNMKVGILGHKGHIIYEITSSINDDLKKCIKEDDDKAAILEKVANLIDHKIHLNYHIFPCNYIALDKLRGEKKFEKEFYGEKELKSFEDYLQKQIDKIDLPNKDIPFLQEKILEMYANPLINHLTAKEEEA